MPRRADWADAFKSEASFVPPILDLSALGPNSLATQEAALEQKRDLARAVYPLLTQFKISQKLRDFATTPQPYGLWAQPADGKTADGEEQHCADPQLGPAASPHVADLTTGKLPPGTTVDASLDLDSAAPIWFADSGLDLSQPQNKQLPVYMERPGESIFNLVCINCHGKDADANSLLANTILELTGGRTRVADLRDGLFGNQGANRADVFPGPNFPTEDTDTMAVRYLLWMGLGGTQATIPSVVLNRVGATRPLGVDRIRNPNTQPTANMLSNVVGFCQDAIGFGLRFEAPDAKTQQQIPGQIQYDDPHKKPEFESSLVASNGDAELWVRLCSLDNPPPIRTISVDLNNQTQYIVKSAYWRDAGDGNPVFPKSARFGDQRGKVSTGLSDDNLTPWCLEFLPPTGGQSADEIAAHKAEVTKLWQSVPGREHEDPPFCPEELFITAGANEQTTITGVSLPAHLLEVPPLSVPDRRRDSWATRGAMNIGASVFLYLDGITKGTFTRKPSFDACALPKTP